MRHLALDGRDLQVAEGVSKDTLNKCGGVDTLFAECFADVPAEVHQVDAFECRINLYGRYLTRGIAQIVFSLLLDNHLAMNKVKQRHKWP